MARTSKTEDSDWIESIFLICWQDFIQKIITDDLQSDTIWRGQGDEHKTLLPSIYRPHHLAAYGQNALKTLKLFYKQAAGRIGELSGMPPLGFDVPPENYEKDAFFSSESARHWWGLAQHHGLPTPYLDWSFYPLVALYFAVESLMRGKSTKYPAATSVWRMEMPRADSDIGAPKYAFVDEQNKEDKCTYTLRFIDQDNLANKRIIAQGGLLSYIVADHKVADVSPVEKYDVVKFIRKLCEIEKKSLLRKYTVEFVNAQDLMQCRLFLMKSGITAKTLFPDITGVVEDCKFRLEHQVFNACPVGVTDRDLFLKFVRDCGEQLDHIMNVRLPQSMPYTPHDIQNPGKE